MRFRSLVPFAAALFVTLPCHAAIFVSDVESAKTDTGHTLHYLLNEAATSGEITVSTTAAPGTAVITQPLAAGDLSQGPHDVAVNTSSLAAGEYRFNVSVSAAPHTGYDVIVPVTAIPDAQTISYGLKVNKVPGSPGYGHIFTADYTAHVVQEMNAAGAFVQNNAVAQTGGFTPVGLAFDTNGDYYITDQNVDQIFQFHATGSTKMPTWAQEADFTGLILDPVNNYGSFTGRGFQLFGTGAEAVAYIASYTPTPNPVLRGTLGNTTDPTEVLFNGSGIAGTRVDQVLVTPDQKTAYISSGAVGGTNLNKFIYGTDPNTNELGWYQDYTFVQNAPETSTLTQRSRGLAFTQDGKGLWVTQALSGGGQDTNYIALVALEPQPNDPVTTAKVLRIAGGLEESQPDTWFMYDLNADGEINMLDAAAAIQVAVPAGSVVKHIPAVIPTGSAGPVLPFTLDTDPKGNLVIGVNADNAGSATVGTSFYVVAQPDNGSNDAVSAPLTIS